MSAPSILLIAMPWHALHLPSIQLGLLQSVLEGAGIQTEVATLGLAFLEHCYTATADLPDGARISVAEYDAVASHGGSGLGDWIFSVPPFRDAPESDAKYLAFLRSREVHDHTLQAALAMRRLVPAFLERMADDVIAVGPKVVGFTSTFSQNVPSLVLAKILKLRSPSLSIVFGGANCDGPMGAALHRAFPWVDVVVRGEAERILPDVVRDLIADGTVRPQAGLCFREGDTSVSIPQVAGSDVAMDEIPTPTFDEYFERLARTSFVSELQQNVALLYETARGCWWGAKSHCTFCGLNGTSMAFRSKSPARVLEELTTLARRYQRLDFEITDNILDLRYLRDVLPQLCELGYDLRLYYETKANLRREQVRLLKRAGVDRIQPGIESLSTPILDLMRKGVTAFQNVQLLKWCAEYGIRPTWNILYGFPGEPPEEYARMTAVVPSLTHLTPPMAGAFELSRFSPYHERAGEFGIEVLGPEPWYGYVYGLDDVTLMDLAYVFEYRHVDGRIPDTYAAPLLREIEAWRANASTSYRSLRYRRGPGFLVIQDRRSNLERADYSFDEAEAQIYLACEDGASADNACAALRAAGTTDLDVADVEQFLDELVDLRLVYEEAGRYLALALPTNLPDARSRPC
jgi:ribosomal peptide maturation radical SAM protein 1